MFRKVFRWQNISLAAGCAFALHCRSKQQHGYRLNAFWGKKAEPVIAAAPLPPQQVDSSPFVLCDKLFDESKVDELLATLQKLSSEIQETCDWKWRMARACRLKSQTCFTPSGKLTWASQALDYAQRAVESDPKNPNAHKWKGITLSLESGEKGVLSQMRHARGIKQAFEQALNLQGSKPDPTTLHLLGVWHYSVSTLTSVERMAVMGMSRGALNASISEALKYLLKAEETEPNFYSKNHLLLAKCYMYEKKFEEAQPWLTKALTTKATSPDDLEVRAEASELWKVNLKQWTPPNGKKQ